MGNLVHLELRGSDLPFLAEEDEEDVVSLSAVNGLPLFWLSLVDETDLKGDWERRVQACFTDPEETGSVPPLCVSWRSAEALLDQAEARVDLRAPALSAMFREWAAGLRELARTGPAQELRLDLGSYSNFHPGAEAFLSELRSGVRIWHGDETVALPVLGSLENDLTGTDDRTGTAFPRARPEWQAGRRPQVDPSPRASRWENLQDWGLALLFAGVVLGSATVGNHTYGAAGGWIGGSLGFILAAGLAWLLVLRLQRRRPR